MDHQDFRVLLEAKAATLIVALRNRDALSVDCETDEFDAMQRGAERDLAISNLDRDNAILKSVRAALNRLSHGSFGICLNCEQPISSKRLAAVPWAALCLKCQELADLRTVDAG